MDLNNNISNEDEFNVMSRHFNMNRRSCNEHSWYDSNGQSKSICKSSISKE